MIISDNNGIRIGWWFNFAGCVYHPCFGLDRPYSYIVIPQSGS